MQYSGEGVNALVCAVDDLEKSTLIYVDLRLRALLKCIAHYEEFKKVLAICYRGFDYEAEKANALGQIGDSYVFRLPKEQKTLVALVSRMLLEFDSGEADILNFAAAYFPSESKQESFVIMCDKIIEPFKRALVDFVWEGIDDGTQNIGRVAELAPNGLRPQTEHHLLNMMNAVNEIAPEDRGDLTMMIEGLAAALDSRDTLMIKCIWQGLKLMLGARKMCAKDVREMDELMRLYLIAK